MKWIVVILVLLNISAWFLGERIDPGVEQSLRAEQAETINVAGMTVIEPAEEMAMRKKNEELVLEEEKITQLKLDERGKVLMAPSTSKEEKVSPVRKPAVETPESVKIVPLDRAKSEAPAAAVQKPAKPAKAEETAASEPVPTPTPAPAPKKPAQAVLTCYRIGPFGDQSSLANVRRVLNRNGIRYAVNKRGTAKKIKAVRIYMGNFVNTAAMQAETKRLKEMGIDHYVVILDGTSVIQLGYFSEPARATAYRKMLKSRGVNASADIVYDEANQNSWLDVQQTSKESIAGLALPKGAQAKEQVCR